MEINNTSKADAYLGKSGTDYLCKHSTYRNCNVLFKVADIQ